MDHERNKLRWGRSLEHDRRSMLAMDDSDTAFPGPGAAGDDAAFDEQLLDIEEESQEAEADEQEQSEQEPSPTSKKEAQKKIKKLAKEIRDHGRNVSKAGRELKMRKTIWGMAGSSAWFDWLPLSLLFPIKVLGDDLLKRVDPDLIKKKSKEIKDLCALYEIPEPNATLKIPPESTSVAAYARWLTPEWVWLIVRWVIAIFLLFLVVVSTIIQFCLTPQGVVACGAGTLYALGKAAL